ncbi:hypothetical protein BH10PSE7_BH10PSE7_01640 [soil metagenome]
MHGLCDPLGAVRVITNMLSFAQGLELTVDLSADFSLLAETRKAARGGLPSPMFDPSVSSLKPANAFWMAARDKQGKPYSLQAFRLDMVYPNLAEWTLGWMTGLYVRRNELILPSLTSPPAHSRANALSGPLVYHGEMWIDRTVKKRDWFDTFLKLGIILAYVKWQPEALWALIGHTIATRGHVARSGYAVQERGFLQWQWRPEGADQSEWLVIAEREHLELLIGDEAARASNPKVDALLG